MRSSTAKAIALAAASGAFSGSYTPVFERGRFVPYLPRISQAKRRKRARK